MKNTEIYPQRNETNTNNKSFKQPFKQEFKQTKIINVPEFKEEDIIIGQYKKTYILIEKENGLEIVDQHIAEERYIYEVLKKNQKIDCQLLFISDIINQKENFIDGIKYAQEIIDGSMSMLILTDKKPKKRQFSLKADKLSEYFSEDVSEDEIEQVILELLDNWKKGR